MAAPRAIARSESMGCTKGGAFLVLPSGTVDPAASAAFNAFPTKQGWNLGLTFRYSALDNALLGRVGWNI